MTISYTLKLHQYCKNRAGKFIFFSDVKIIKFKILR
jgi:hypothetical protein